MRGGGKSLHYTGSIPGEQGNRDVSGHDRHVSRRSRADVLRPRRRQERGACGSELIRAAARGGAPPTCRRPRTPFSMEFDRLAASRCGAARGGQSGARALPGAWRASSASGCTSARWRCCSTVANSPTARSSSRPMVRLRRATTISTCSTSISVAVTVTLRARTTSRAGRRVVADLPWGGLGLTICYDLRFPPSLPCARQGGGGFPGHPVGLHPADRARRHWHVLMRARAIENGCFVLAAAQAGKHETRPGNLRPQPGRLALGRDPGRGGRRSSRQSSSLISNRAKCSRRDATSHRFSTIGRFEVAHVAGAEAREARSPLPAQVKKGPRVRGLVCQQRRLRQAGEARIALHARIAARPRCRRR